VTHPGQNVHYWQNVQNQLFSNIMNESEETTMAKRMSAKDARSKFSDLLGIVNYGGEEVIVERSGRPVAAVIPFPVYERLVAERKARFEVIERVRARLPEVSIEAIQADVHEAIAKVRKSHAAGRS
jgi:prevent-host-death family protein